MTKSFTIKSLSSILLFIFFFASTIFAQPDSVFYHDGSFENQWGSGGATLQYDYYRYVERFTPPYYPAKLVGIRGWFRNATDPTSTLRAVWYPEPTGSATGPGVITGTLTSTIYTNPAIGGVTDSSYSLYMDISSYMVTINSGDVYAGVTQHQMQNGFLALAMDNQNNFTLDRPWVFAGTWYQMQQWAFVNGEWGLAAYFMPVTTGVDEMKNEMNISAFPNPAKDNTDVTYLLKENTNVTMALYNAIGEKVEEIISNEKQNSGSHFVTISTAHLSKGIYFLRLNSSVVKLCKM